MISAAVARASDRGHLARLEVELEEDLAGFQHDPLGYVLYAFPWGEGELADFDGPYDWQRDILDEIGTKLRAGVEFADALQPVLAAVASGHGIGKSALVAWVILWALSTFEDTRGVVTANTEKQLTSKTWPEVQKWHRLAVNAHWFQWTATALFSNEPGHEKTWRFDAIAWSEHNSEAFAGLHNKGKRIVLIFDEASAIADVIWEVAEGALTDEGTEILWLAFGNPTRATGRFRECFRKFAHRWSHRNIDSREVPGTNKVQLAKWIEDNGVDSDFVKIRVRGLFPLQSALQFISEEDVDAAYGRQLRTDEYSWAPKVISVDPAWTGDDELVIAMRQGLAFQLLRVIPRNDNDDQVADVVAQLQDEHGADAVFIDQGWGTGIFSRGKTLGRTNWRLVNFGQMKDLKDPGCLNKRAEMWKAARDWLKEGGALPDDPLLRDDLLGPETVPRADGKLQLESKEDMKARGLRSPNRGDALAITFAFTVQDRSRAQALSDARNRRMKNSLGDSYNPFARDD